MEHLLSFHLVLVFFSWWALLEVTGWYLKKNSSFRWRLYRFFGMSTPDFERHPMKMVVALVFLFFFGWVVCLAHFLCRICLTEN